MKITGVFGLGFKEKPEEIDQDGLSSPENSRSVEYLMDMNNLRDILSHGGDPRATSNRSGALWKLADGGNSMRLMGAEGFIQAVCDLAEQTIIAFGGSVTDIPEWPEPARSGLSAERRPELRLL